MLTLRQYKDPSQNHFMSDPLPGITRLGADSGDYLDGRDPARHVQCPSFAGCLPSQLMSLKFMDLHVESRVWHAPSSLWLLVQQPGETTHKSRSRQVRVLHQRALSPAWLVYLHAPKSKLPSAESAKLEALAGPCL